MDCQLFERQMQRGIDGRLDTGEREDMLKHAQDCPDCAALLQDMTALDVLLKEQLTMVDAPEGFGDFVMSALPAPYPKPVLRVLLPAKRWQRWASAAAAALLVAAGAYGLLQPGQQPNIATEPLSSAIADVADEQKPLPAQEPIQNNTPNTQVATVIPPLNTETPVSEEDPVSGGENNEVTAEEIPDDAVVHTTTPDMPVVAQQPFSAAVDLPKPAAYNPQPQGMLSQVLLAAYDDCDAMLPSLNGEGLVEFYIKYKGVSHLWTQSLTAAEPPVYVGQVKSLPSVAQITGSVSQKDEEGNAWVSAFAPDGVTLAVNRGGELPGLWLYENAEEIDLTALTEEQALVEAIPNTAGGGKFLSWSPDGNKILYTDASGKLFVYYLAEQLSFELYGGAVTCASWADDSMTVVFAGKESKDQRSAIYTILLP